MQVIVKVAVAAKCFNHQIDLTDRERMFRKKWDAIFVSHDAEKEYRLDC